VRKILGLVLVPLVLAAGCGGGGGSSGGGTPPPPPPPPAQVIAPPGPPNVERIIVDSGPAGLTLTAVNTAYVSVNVCQPGTNTCKLIDHIEIDSGSVGLRIISSELAGITLPAVSSGPNAECLAFADGDSWGSLAVADMELPVSGKKAAGITVHVIGDPSVGAAPSFCQGMKTENTVADFGANGILGVGPFINDCNSAGDCGHGTQSANYYTCTAGGSSCSQATATLAQQVPNPVVTFAADNNGVIIELPAVSGATQASPTGSLVLGIGTQSNNALGSATKLSANASTGNITASLNGTNFQIAYLDSGSNANFFHDSALTVCPAPNAGFYCPAAIVSENATLTGAGAVTLAAPFSVDNAVNMFSQNATYTAFPDLSGPAIDNTAFDLGLSFFFGRNVFTGFESVSANTEPYFAY